LYAAFTIKPDMRPFESVKPSVDMTATNKASDYGAKVSESMNLFRMDGVSDALLNDIEAHSVGNVASLKYEGR
jgi:hypothetical protein